MTSNPPEATIMPPAPPEDPGGQMTFFEHLVELRKRIITSLIAVGIGAGVGWFVAPHFVSWITKPMLKALADQHLTQQLVYTNPTGFLSLLIALSIYLGLVLASPVVLYQFWLFVAPALYKHERSATTGFLFSTVILFLAGIGFGYFMMLPKVLKFLISFQGPVVPLISVNEYFDLTLMVLLGAGLIFELPVLIFFLTLFGIVTPKFLFVNSKYAILVIAIIAAIVTPTPDALTMLVVMAPMVVLYFAGIGVSALVVGKRNRRLAAAAAGTPAAEAH
ncbi:MAG TPA: twin-arginine translocase subunit TatC [Methylomirabilota bacterium]|nr:twin-arginine translocase subunit TatC [Methylomirabilota bacterium]